ncbi:MAG: Rid family hydrolase [Candidatus Binatia bacterium]
MQSASTSQLPVDARRGVTARRIAGAVVDELHLLARPSDPAAGVAAQAASAYGSLVAVLKAQGAGPESLVIENVFLRPLASDYHAVAAERARAFGSAGFQPDGPASTFIGQAPLEGDGACLEVAAVALLPRGPGATFLPAVHAAASCTCPACAAGFRGRLVRLGSQTQLHAGNVFGRGGDAVAEAFDMFVEAEKLLAAAGMDFGDVLRTWIHLRDIDRDYAALNQARRDFFAARGIERRPASTGVQGIPFAADHDFSLSLFAVKSARPLDVPLMSTPALNEAWTYGADFSRGLRLVDDNKVSLLVSGTASIDERGLSVHDGDLAAQVERMLHNIETLLEEQGAGFADLVSAVTYVKRAGDAPLVARLLAARGFGGFPLAVVEAPLCRPELLCETEAVAVLPLTAGAR